MGKENNKNETEKICFVIMPISDHPNYPKGHFTNIYEQVFKPAIEEAGFISKRVDEDKISSDIMTKILEGVTKSEMAICDLSSRNPNVMYELGLRHAYGKPVVLICDNKTERIFDVAGINTVTYKSERLYEDVIEARNDVKEAIISTEKNPHSILNFAKIQAAELHTSENIDDNDYLKIMLMSIMNEIEGIKQANVNGTTVDELTYVDYRMNSINEELHNIKMSIKKDDEISRQELIYYLERIRYMKNQLTTKDIPRNTYREATMRISILEKMITDILCKYEE